MHVADQGAGNSQIINISSLAGVCKRGSREHVRAHDSCIFMLCKNMDANTCLCIFARAIPGKCGIGLRSGYCGAKAAVLGWMDALRAEEAALGTGRPDGNAQILTRCCSFSPRPSLPPCPPSQHLNHIHTYDDRSKNPERMPGLSQDANLKQCPHRRRQQIWSHGPQHFHRLACRILVRAYVRAFVLLLAAPLHVHAHVQYRIAVRVCAWGNNASCCLFVVYLGVQLPARAPISCNLPPPAMFSVHYRDLSFRSTKFPPHSAEASKASEHKSLYCSRSSRLMPGRMENSV